MTKKHKPIVRGIVKGPYPSDNLYIVEAIVGAIQTGIKFFFRNQEEAQRFVDKYATKDKKS